MDFKFDAKVDYRQKFSQSKKVLFRVEALGKEYPNAIWIDFIVIKFVFIGIVGSFVYHIVIIFSFIKN
jgi:hypothetical protein